MNVLPVCGECKNSVTKDSDGINYDLCRAMLHVTCAGLSRLEADCLKSRKKRINFFCNKCNLVDIFENLKKEIEKLSSFLNKLKRKNANANDATFKVEALIATEEIISEIEDSQKRSNS